MNPNPCGAGFASSWRANSPALEIPKRFAGGKASAEDSGLPGRNRKTFGEPPSHVAL